MESTLDSRGGRKAQPRRGRAAMTVLGVCVASMLLLAGSASAHVKVFSNGAKAGHAATLQFRVPSEKASVTTIRIDVALPKDVHPTAVPTVAGWTHQEDEDGGVTHVRWTAQAGHEIKPDSHHYFNLGVGPLPNEPSLSFAVFQTYSDGSVVKWNEPETGGMEAEFPSAVLVLDAAAAAKQKQAQAAAPPTPNEAAAPGPAVAATSEADASAEASGSAWILWTLAGVVVVVALVAVGAVTRSRRRRN